MLKKKGEIAFLIAAAGFSSRMGRAKSLLPFNDKMTFIERLVFVAIESGLNRIWVTLPMDIYIQKEIRSDLEKYSPNIFFIDNKYMKEGLLGSIKSTVGDIEKQNLLISSLIFTPIDAPFVTVKDFHLLKKELENTKERAPAFQLIYREKSGHPAAISAQQFKYLPLLQSPKELFVEGDVLLIESENERICLNINTPEAYQQYFSDFV